MLSRARGRPACPAMASPTPKRCLGGRRCAWLEESGWVLQAGRDCRGYSWDSVGGTHSDVKEDLNKEMENCEAEVAICEGLSIICKGQNFVKRKMVFSFSWGGAIILSVLFQITGPVVNATYEARPLLVGGSTLARSGRPPKSMASNFGAG